MTPPPADLPDIADPLTFAARAQAWVIWMNTWFAELTAIIGITIPAGSAAASTLTGDTLAANVVASSLTSVGTLSALTVAGATAFNGAVTLGDNAADVLLMTTNAMKVNAAGEITQPLQPSFCARASNQTDVTGDATVYTVIFANERFDQGADFDGASTFTAPVTGRYMFCVSISMDQLAAGHNIQIVNLVTSNSAYILTANITGAGANVLTQWVACGSQIVDMDAGDTATITIDVRGATKVVDLSTDCVFSGHLSE